MAEQNTGNPNESRLKRRAVGSGAALFISALVVLALIGFFASHSGIDRKLAEKRLAEWTKAAAEMAAEQGYVLTLTYDDIEIEGSLFSKKAAVKNIVLSAAPQDAGEADRTRSMTTGVLYLDPDMLGGGLSVILTDPLLYITPEGRTRIVAGEPIEMVVEDYQNDTGRGIAYTLLTPPHLSMERLGRQSDAVISSTDIGFGPESKVYGMIDRAKGTYTQEAQLKAVTIRRNDRAVAINDFQSTMESASQNGSLLTHYDVALTGVTTNGPLEPLGMMNASLDVEFEEPMLVNGEPLNLSLGRDRYITLEKLLVEAASGKFLVKANLRQVYNEIMPFGTASLQIENPVQVLDTFTKTGYLKNIPTDIVKAMLARVAPDWQGDDSPLTIPLKRDPNGPFYIGSLTFEELTAVLLSQLLQQNMPDLALPGVAPQPAEEGADSPTAPAAAEAPAVDGASASPENSPAESSETVEKPSAEPAAETVEEAPVTEGATQPVQ